MTRDFTLTLRFDSATQEILNRFLNILEAKQQAKFDELSGKLEQLQHRLDASGDRLQESVDDASQPA